MRTSLLFISFQISAAYALSAFPAAFANLANCLSSQNGALSLSSALSLRRIASRTIIAPHQRIGSGGKLPFGPDTNPHRLHPLSRSNTNDDKICPPIHV